MVSDYNVIYSEITENCISLGSSYCEAWSITSVKTINYFDLLLLLSIPLILILLVFVFRKKK